MDITAGGRATIRKEITRGLAAFDYSSIATATIKNLDDGTQVTCHFRPHEYTFVKANSWKANPTTASKNIFQAPTYESTTPYKLTMELLFDTNEAPGDQDVRKI